MNEEQHKRLAELCHDYELPALAAFIDVIIVTTRREEREGCARVAEAEESTENKDEWTITVTHTAHRIAAAIRARGESDGS